MNVLASRLSRLALVAAASLALAACSSTPKTFANADPTANFGAYQTFGFVDTPGTDSKPYETLETNFLKDAISRELTRRGMSYAESSPDIIVNFHVHSQDKIKSRSTPATGYGAGWYDPWYDTWGGYGGWRTEVYQVTEGTLIIDVVDADARKLVWEGSAQGRITDEVMRNLEAVIYETVTLIMDGYPIVPPAAEAPPSG